ncbi:site-specific DNA-methyltransferase [Caulobacter sp. 1776]|uniref:DNA-methyltransferase n=1 Tax=Caulobacter sp. 1776 TaxID=3156420 RepID=UPI00339ADDE1
MTRAATPPAEVASPLNALFHGDFLVLAARLADDSVDVVIADPPYNASKGGDWTWDAKAGLPGFGGDWKKVDQTWDDMSLDQYFGFTLAWLGEVKRVLKPTGSLWVHGTYHNIGVINVAMQMLGIEIINEVAWYKRNSFPNLSARRLTASHETILWAHVGKTRRYRFNYDWAKAASFPEDRLKEAGKQMRTVWDVPNNKARDELAHGKHPTQKPLRLAERILKLSAAPGQVCLVPFAGAGTECVAAVREGLDFIAAEVDEAYVEIARRRLAAEAVR